MNGKFSDAINGLSEQERIILADALELFANNIITIGAKFTRDCSRVNNSEINESMQQFTEQQNEMTTDLLETAKLLRGE